MKQQYVYFLIKNIFYLKSSKIVNCELVRQDDLQFDLEGPACNTFIGEQEQALLCDSSANCHT